MIDKAHVEYLEGDDGVPYLRIIDGEFTGISLKIGAISFPDEDQPVMQFQYDIIEGTLDDVRLFENALGDFIVRLLEERFAKQQPVPFVGGVDDIS